MNWSFPNNVVIQGINEPQAASYATQMKAYGTDIVAGISPGRGGTTIENIPVFDLIEQVLTLVDRIDTSLIFAAPYQVLDAVREAIDVGIKRVIILTPHVPPLDTIKAIEYAEANNIVLLGPGSHGIIIPEQVWLGNLHPQYYRLGKVGLLSTSKYLSYEVASELNQADLGQSIVVSLGDDGIVGSNLSQWLPILNEDPETEAIVTIGHSINQTEEIVAYAKNHGFDKPVIAYVAGFKTPKERMFRDAITIISNHLSASIPAVNQERRILNQLKKVGVKIAKRPSEIPSLVSDLLKIEVN